MEPIVDHVEITVRDIDDAAAAYDMVAGAKIGATIGGAVGGAATSVQVNRRQDEVPDCRCGCPRA